MLSTDDYENTISGGLINIDGSYCLKAIDLAGNETIIEFILNTAAPELKLNGVEDNGTTKGIVKLTGLSEDAKLTVYLNGTEISYSVGESFTELGTYRVVVTDLADNTTEYNFEIIYSKRRQYRRHCAGSCGCRGRHSRGHSYAQKEKI